MFDVCGALKNTQNIRKLRETVFSIDNPYNTISLFSVCDYLKFLQEQILKCVSSTWSDEYYIRHLNNRSVGWFSRKIGKLGDYYIQNKELVVSSQGKH